jgi:cobalt-zinc-cadmium efflux system protein
VVVLGVEAVGALLSRSLALTIDAAHDVPDIFAFTASYLALTAIARGSSREHTFGSHRFEVFAAILNAFVILAAGLLFAYPAAVGLTNGTTPFGPIDPIWILFAAVPTLALRSISAAYLGRIPRATRDLNVRSVIVHLWTDIAITATLIVDAIILLRFPASVQVDSVSALVVAAILVVESVPIFRGAWDVLTERVPRGLSLTALTESIKSDPRVREVHDLHVWAVCPTFVCMTVHVRVEATTLADCANLTSNLRHEIEQSFGIAHSVFELEAYSPPSRGRLREPASTG